MSPCWVRLWVRELEFSLSLSFTWSWTKWLATAKWSAKYSALSTTTSVILLEHCRYNCVALPLPQGNVVKNFQPNSWVVVGGEGVPTTYATVVACSQANWVLTRKRIEMICLSSNVELYFILRLCLWSLLLTVNKGNEIWDLWYCPLNKRCPRSLSRLYYCQDIDSLKYRRHHGEKNL